MIWPSTENQTTVESRDAQQGSMDNSTVVFGIPASWPQGRIKGRQRGKLPRAIANLFVSNKILVWKIFVIKKRYRNTTLYYIPMLR